MNDPLEFLLILFFSFLFFVIIPLSLIKHFIVKPFVEAMDRKTEMFRESMQEIRAMVQSVLERD